MRVLIVEDDKKISDLLSRALKEESYATDQAFDGEEGEWLGFENPYDLIILDIMLPRKDGLTVLSNWRKGGINSPVLLLTAKDATDDVVKGLDKGADDYLKKPFSIDELFARIRALLRRPHGETAPEITAGPMVIDPSRREVKIFDKPLELTAKEYALLEYFARYAGSVLTRTQLSEHVWDMNFDPLSNVVDVYVGYLRNKLEPLLGRNAIKTVRGHGYMLDVESGLKSATAGSEETSMAGKKFETASAASL